MYRSLITLGLAGCVAFDSTPSNRTPDAMTRDAALPDGPETLSEAAARVTARFQACMTLSDFVESGMTTWAELLTDTGNKCSECHGDGNYGFIATLDATRFFEALRTNNSLFYEYLTPDLTAGAPQARIVANTAHLTSVGSGGPNMHPTYLPEPGLDAIERFRSATEGNAPGDCGP